MTCEFHQNLEKYSKYVFNLIHKILIHIKICKYNNIPQGTINKVQYFQSNTWDHQIGAP